MIEVPVARLLGATVPRITLSGIAETARKPRDTLRTRMTSLRRHTLMRLGCVGRSVDAHLVFTHRGDDARCCAGVGKLLRCRRAAFDQVDERAAARALQRGRGGEGAHGAQHGAATVDADGVERVGLARRLFYDERQRRAAEQLHLHLVGDAPAHGRHHARRERRQRVVTGEAAPEGTACGADS
eukprot:5336680-Pleurochrysis_carterae.AAC.4